MSRPPEPILIINDGSLAALVASLLAPDLSRIIAWLPPSGSSLRGVGADEASQLSLVTQQADLMGYERVISPPALPRPVGERWIEQTQSLLAAVASACESGCTRVIWPVVAGDRMAEMLEFSERGSLLNRLCWLGESDRQSSTAQADTQDRTGPAAGSISMNEGEVRSIRVETPFVDLVPSQIGDMARDLDAPLQVCWWDAEAHV